MAQKSRSSAAAAVGVLALLCMAGPARADDIARPAGPVASLTAGSIAGVVQDENGAAIAGVMVSAVGATTSFAVTDCSGRFELLTLTPGPYLLRAHISGFVVSQGQMIEVLPSARFSSSISLQHLAAASSATVLTAGLGGAEGPVPAESPESVGTPGAKPEAGAPGTVEDQSEVAWRLRHARRGVLRDATLPEDLLADDPPGRTAGGFGPQGIFVRAVASSAHLASFFSNTPLSGQVNLLTTGTLDSPLHLFSTDNLSRNVAFLSLGAPVGSRADWRARAALTQGDISSWIVAAAYTTRAPARHQYDVGMSYSAQRYETGSPTALRDGTSGSRSAGAVYGFDTFTISPAVSVTYGARIARYDYLDEGALVSPRAALQVSPGGHVRINAAASRRALAPGAEEFLPPPGDGIWLPPQRTFSSFSSDRRLEAERVDHVELEVERDMVGGTVSLRTFHQQVTDQLVTMFGVDPSGSAAPRPGHYLVTNAGDFATTGWSAGFRAPLVGHVHGSVDYSQSRAQLNGNPDLAYLILVAPSAIRLESEHVHNVSTTVETEVPETSTRVLVLYRVSNAFAAAADRPTFDSRFDVQVRQSLPFMDFTSAKWEMLLAVRNVFREGAFDASVYDELLVIRPPKRIVGGLTLRF